MSRLAAALLFLAVLAVPARADPPKPGPLMQPSKAMQAVMTDGMRNFFETAASANQFEIESSKLALQRLHDAAMKDYAEMMIKDHANAGAELRKLARQKNVTLSNELLRRHALMLEDLKDEPQGSHFDDEYRDKMITSHKEAVSLFDEAARESEDPDVKAFAAKMLPKLQAHGGAADKLPQPDKLQRK